MLGLDRRSLSLTLTLSLTLPDLNLTIFPPIPCLVSGRRSEPIIILKQYCDDLRSDVSISLIITRYDVVATAAAADDDDDVMVMVMLEAREYCQWENFNASCPRRDEVVLMRTARYGRIRFGRCMREDHGSVGCAADVLVHLDRKCSGRRSCRIMIPDATLHGIHPCPKELMPYLEASYLCVRGNRCCYSTSL